MKDIAETIENIIFSEWFRVLCITVLVIAGLYLLYRILRFLRYLQVRAIRYERYFSDDRAYCGDEIYLFEKIYNRTPFPVFLVDAEGWIARGLGIDGYNLDAIEPMQKFVSRFNVIMPYNEITRMHVITCVKRGFYTLESIEIEADGKKRLIYAPVKLHVYPAHTDVDTGEPPFTNLYGEYGVRRALIADKFSVSGVRDYRKGDSFDMINFKATAKNGYIQNILKVNSYDFTQNINCAVFLNFNTTRDYGTEYSKYEQMMERGLSVAASVLNDTIEIGGRAAFYANCKLSDGSMYITFPLDGGSVQLYSILEALAEIKPGDGYSFAALLDLYLRNGVDNTHFVIISPPIDEAIREKIDMLENGSCSVSIITLRENIDGRRSK